ncbi:cytochrome c peroxidase [Flammeovirga sp. SubArs3]|uniref:cytochrome-c peroxidase n=1 Tax=Flammeovirga sp. SubArs3 TaxID=2995316 RepID=UPI00248BD406|nr:cytochrome c peroxidase [Flammeovirga sp. SubArs3]
MERYYCTVILLSICSLIFEACDSSEKSKSQASVISYENIPAPERNSMRKDRVALGKLLFHDTNLSKGKNISCSTCHLSAYNFGENVTVSHNGASGKKLHRNTPPLINIAWAKGWFWEGGAKNIESLIYGPLLHEDEMSADLKEVVNYLNASQEYKERFTSAYGIQEIKSAHLVRALAQYCRSLISNQSNYDLHLQGKYQFTPLEKEGHIAFNNHCSSCHTPPFFTDFDYHNNGLDTVFSDTLEGLFQGRARITLKEEDMGKYKTPTLRNIFASAPYMHDGRFKDIEDVFEHYEKGILISKSTDSTLINGIPLKEHDKKSIKAFLWTLMDTSFLQTDII